jgi:hypothetical protein
MEVKHSYQQPLNVCKYFKEVVRLTEGCLGEEECGVRKDGSYTHAAFTINKL